MRGRIHALVLALVGDGESGGGALILRTGESAGAAREAGGVSDRLRATRCGSAPSGDRQARGKAQVHGVARQERRQLPPARTHIGIANCLFSSFVLAPIEYLGPTGWASWKYSPGP